MRILMTTDAIGGVWSYCVELTRALRPLGIEVVVASMGPRPSPAQARELSELDNAELLVSEFRLEWMDESEDEVRRAGEWLLELERTHRPELVHLNNYAHAALPWRVPALVVGHSCVLSWWRAVRGEPAPAQFDGYRRMVRAGLEGARVVVAPTAWMLAQLRLDYELCFEGVVIPNARRSEDYRPRSPGPFVLSAGRMWDEAKNLAALDAAARELPWRVYVAGEAAHPEGHRATARHAGLLGSLSPRELGWWMSRASIYAHPALYEPFGLTPLEAALAGCALVLGDIGSLREVWGDAAVFVPAHDHAALAAALRELIEDPRRRASMAARAHTRALRYGVARMSAAYHDLYRALTRAPPRALSACGS